jgi:SPP1 gp7 family putative phage head morphogenesis protein
LIFFRKSSLTNGKRKERAKIEAAFSSELRSLFRSLLLEILPEGTTEETLTVDEALAKNQTFGPKLKDVLSKHIKRSALYGTEIGQDQVEKLRGTGKDLSLASDWELANDDVLLWVMGAPGTSGYTDLLTSGMLATNENQLRKHIGDWILNGQPLSELTKTLRNTTFGKRRAAAIAATEVTRAFAKGNNLAWKRAGIIKKQRWQTAFDELVCPQCGPLSGTIVSIDESFYTGENSTFENGLPPRHSRCRCWITPVADETGTSVSNHLIVESDGETAQLHLKHYQMIPQLVRDALVKAGVKVFINNDKTLPFIDNEEEHKGKSPRGWPEGMTWDIVPGGYDRKQKHVIAGNGSHGSVSLLLHEYGHAVGHTLGYDYDQRLIDIHTEIFPKLIPYLQQGGPGGKAGVEELLAEGFADTVLSRYEATKKYGKEFVDYIENSVFTLESPGELP